MFSKWCVNKPNFAFCEIYRCRVHMQSASICWMFKWGETERWSFFGRVPLHGAFFVSPYISGENLSVGLSSAGLPLHAAFFVPPYSSHLSVDTPNYTPPTTQDTSWQQVLQRHWESIWQKKLTGILEYLMILVSKRYACKM